MSETDASRRDMHAALQCLQEGKPVLIMADLQPAGILALPALSLTVARTNQMLHASRGAFHVVLEEERLDDLGLPRQPPSRPGLAPFYVPVDAASGTTTGISAGDRTATVRALIDPLASLGDFVRPGHVTPIASDPSGVLGRFGLAEAARDLSRAAVGHEAAVFVSVLDDQGELAGASYLGELARQMDSAVVRISDVVRFRRESAGWRGPFKAHETHEIPYLPGNVTVAGRIGDRPLESVRVSLEWLCIAGHLLGGECECRDRVDRLLDALSDDEGWVVGVIWRTETDARCSDRPVDDELRCLQREGLARLLAAYHAGAAADYMDAPQGPPAPSPAA